MRLTSYRPTLDRIVFALGILGILVVVHLWIQTGRGFDRGCLGFSAPAAAPTADCSVVVQSEASTLFGVSNILWGLVFYFVITALSVALPFFSGSAMAAVKRVRAAMIGVGFLYAMYLVFVQFVQLGEFCVLCLTSATIVTLLLLTQVIDVFKPAKERLVALPKPQIMREARMLASSIGVLIAFIVVDIAYFNSLDTSQAEPVVTAAAPPAAPSAQVAAQTSPALGECRYDPNIPPVEDYMSLVTFSDPGKGTLGAPVTILEFFDPNCPHCKTFVPFIDQLMERHEDNARLVYKPFPIGRHSVAQVEGLMYAAQQGKFEQLMRAQFAMQKAGGLSREELMQAARQSGLDADAMIQAIEAGTYRNELIRQARKASEIGVNSVPKVMINGRFITSASRTVDCMSQLIQAELNP